MKTILVTGGAGFIGSHLCERLLDEGNRVICLDNFFTGRKENIAFLEENPNFSVIIHDIIEPLPQLGNVDEIYNLACPASPIHYQIDPIETIKSNTIGVINVLEFAREKRSKVLQASTSEVYGDPSVHPQPESYLGNVNIIGPRACYDEGKRVAETLFMDYHRKYGLDIGIVRIFNTYGPRMAKNDGRVVSNFIIQALFGQDITVYGDGSQTRSFQYVSDLIDGLVKMMGAKGFIGPVNIGNPREITISELARIIIKLTGSSSKLTYAKLPQDDPRQRQPLITLANEKLCWTPKKNLDEGLKETIDYFAELHTIRQSKDKRGVKPYKKLRNRLAEGV